MARGRRQQQPLNPDSRARLLRRVTRGFQRAVVVNDTLRAPVGFRSGPVLVMWDLSEVPLDVDAVDASTVGSKIRGWLLAHGYGGAVEKARVRLISSTNAEVMPLPDLVVQQLKGSRTVSYFQRPSRKRDAVRTCIRKEALIWARELTGNATFVLVASSHQLYSRLLTQLRNQYNCHTVVVYPPPPPPPQRLIGAAATSCAAGDFIEY